MRLTPTLADQVDVVIIDTPPLAVTTEALEFVPVSKVVLLVGRIGRTPTTVAQRAGELIRFGGAEQVAVALTDTGSSRLRRQSYYDYYGGRRGKRPIGPRPAAEPIADEPSGRNGDEWREIDEMVHHEPAPGDPTPTAGPDDLSSTERPS